DLANLGGRGHPELGKAVGSERRAIGVGDQVAVLVLHPAEMELARGHDDDLLVFVVGPETGQPRLPVALGDCRSQGLPERNPTVSGLGRLLRHASPSSGRGELSTESSTPVETRDGPHPGKSSFSGPGCRRLLAAGKWRPHPVAGSSEYRIAHDARQERENRCCGLPEATLSTDESPGHTLFFQVQPRLREAPGPPDWPSRTFRELREFSRHGPPRAVTRRALRRPHVCRRPGTL